MLIDIYVDVNVFCGMTSSILDFATTLHVRDHCLCLAAQRAARALARRFDIALRPVGLTNGQFSLLMSLNRPEPPTLGSVASLLAMDRTTLTAALKPLEREGLIATTADPKDRRSRLLQLTAAGRQRLEAALPIWRETHRLVDEAFEPAEGKALRQSLNKIG